ncbi:MAG: hypothetical protein ACHQ4H_09840 [Ktedonobacterales bacterium]
MADFADGMPVYDESGTRVGTLNLRETADYLVIEQEGGGTLFVPLSAVGRSDASGIYLNLTADVLRDPNWRMPPLPQE